MQCSGVGMSPLATTLAGRMLHFVGAYHAPTPAHSRALSPLGEALRSFKDRRDRYAGRCLSRLFAERCATLVSPQMILVPIPSDADRLRERGLSSAAWLAAALSRRCGATMCTQALQRVPGRPPQRGLGGAARRSNARDAFVLGPRTVRGYSVVLADDVVTTGATLGDAARCLTAAGVSEVTCIVLACADEEMVRTCRSRTGNAGTNVTERRPV